VTRVDGIATKTARIFDELLDTINVGRGLANTDEKMTLRDVLGHSEEGKQIIQEGQTASVGRVLAENAVRLAGMRGKAFTSTVVGVLSAGLRAKQASALFNISETRVRSCVQEQREAKFDDAKKGI
jgi:hypothetical protein